MSDAAVGGPRLIDRFDTLLLDLDGVVYIGLDPVPHAATAIAAARAAGVSCVYVTNNANRPATVVAQHLVELGVPATAADVVTSPQAAAALLCEWVPDGSCVLVIGGSGIDEALTEAGYLPVRARDPQVAAVMQGFSPDVSWRDLAMASYAVADGLPWIATNLDRTIPTPLGIAPGNGTLVGVVTAATGRVPDAVAGKPEPPLLRAAVERAGARRPLMIGDRLDTDIAAGPRAGVPTLLVLTGVTTLADLLVAGHDERPDHVTLDLAGLLEPYPEVSCTQAGTTVTVEVGAVRATLADGRLALVGDGPAGQIAHAAAAACWAAADAGLPVDLDQVRAVVIAAAPAVVRVPGTVGAERREAHSAR